jgi:CubicO group peptidase (beta-lactamase class C family)
MLGVFPRAKVGISRVLPGWSSAIGGALLFSGAALASSDGTGPDTFGDGSAAPAAQATASGVAAYWPTHGWRRSTPEAQGIDSRVLADAIDTIRARHIPVNSLLIERHGSIVVDASFYPYDADRPHEVFSVTKSVTSSLVGIAVADGRLASLDMPVSTLLPGQVPADANKSRITLAHLLSMTSGLDCSTSQGMSFLEMMEHSPHWVSYALERPEVAEPGTRFGYCAGNMHVVSAVLTRVTGQSAADYARARLFAPLGITEVSWPGDADGISHGFADLQLSPRDMAKLGYLWLHHGVWEGKQIIPAAYLADALSPHATVEPGVQYGYGMWLYPGRGHAGGPPDFEANGVGGQRIAVIPSQDIVEVITGQSLDANEVASLVSDAVKSDAALPEDPQEFGRLKTDVVEARTGGSVDSSFALAAVEPKSRPEPAVVTSTSDVASPVFAVTPKPRPEVEIAAVLPAEPALPGVTPKPRPAIEPASRVSEIDPALAGARPKPRPEPLVSAWPTNAPVFALNAPALHRSLDVASNSLLRVAVAPKPRPGS